MPCAQIQVSSAGEVDAATKQKIATEACRILSEVLGKPIGYCMATIVQVTGAMGGSDQAVAFVKITSIGGLDARSNARLSAGFCRLIHTELGTDPERIYLNFENTQGSNWGHNSKTF